MAILMQLDKTKNFIFEISTGDDVPRNFPEFKNVYSKLSRVALFNSLKNITSNPNFDDLQISRHLHLTNFPDYKVSLSHTKDISCALLSNCPNYQSIGVDIEWESRLVKPGIEKFYINENDTEKLTKLEVWMAKEAIFKAISPLYKGDKVLVLKDIAIDEESFKCFNFKGSFEFYSKNISNKNIKIAIAWV